VDLPRSEVTSSFVLAVFIEVLAISPSRGYTGAFLLGIYDLKQMDNGYLNDFNELMTLLYIQRIW